MINSSAFRRLLLGAAALPLMAASPLSTLPNGRPQHLTAHTHPLSAPISRLQDAGPMPGAIDGLHKAYGGTPIDVLTFHNDNGRTGWNRSETDLTQASVASTKFGLLQTLNVDGNVFAEPLLVSRFMMPDGTRHDILIVATGHDTVYAYDAQSYAILWQVSLGTPQSSNDIGCGDVVPEYGITSTPVILRQSANAATVYVVSATEPASFSFHTQLHALNLATGADVVPPVEIAPSAKLSNGAELGFSPQNNWSRAGLAANNGMIYVSISSHCDNNENAISGWLLRYSAATLRPGTAFHTIETPHGGIELAAIWMSGFAPSIDADGNVFVVTGNGDFTKGAKDWGESVLKLPPGLSAVTSKFTPAAYTTLNNNDADFGSGGVMLIPRSPGQTTPPMAVAMGKSAVLYLLNQKALGGLTMDDSGALQAQQLNGFGNFGGPAYFSNVHGPMIYYQINSDVLRAYSVATTGTPALTQTATGTTQGGFGGSMPIVSSNGQASGTGIVWLIRRSNPLELEAYDADTLGAPIFSANAGTWSNQQHQNGFLTAMVANGRVYAPAYKTVKVFGLTP